MNENYEYAYKQLSDHWNNASFVALIKLAEMETPVRCNGAPEIWQNSKTYSWAGYTVTMLHVKSKYVYTIIFTRKPDYKKMKLNMTILIWLLIMTLTIWIHL